MKNTAEIDFASKQFGENVKKRRKALNIKQTELAEMVGLSVTQLSTIENGNSKTSFAGIVNLCYALDVTPNYLILGSMSSSNLPQNIIDIIKDLSPEKQDFIFKVINDLKDL